MVDNGFFEDHEFINILKNTKKDFYLTSFAQNDETIFNGISSKQLKMIKLLALYIVTNKDKNINVIENVKLLYKGKHIFDWLEDRNHEFYEILTFFKKRYNVIINENNKLYTLRNYKNQKIDTNHPLNKQILLEKLYILSLGKEREIYLKIKAQKNNKALQYHKYIEQSIDWLKILKDTYKEEDSEIINNGHDFTAITLPALEEVLPTLVDKEMNYNLDIKSLKKMKSNLEKKQLIANYFKENEENSKSIGNKKRKLDEIEDNNNRDNTKSQPETKKKKTTKKNVNRKVVLDPTATRSAIKK
ncbi:hypothetical protein HANVADRAFT_4985 [Hanseniaspora valbyensis NRRL Y-1626]|uniref:Uncharacterized protein n=1 Tax=Hanseniaspora valbyensis NRRL Y-1626 TaxID=766949 RepID=A0A1B7TIV0_9ASCO|nr:hypothetical protein HANVADRAFT_4985 [Hanseniaspora valbyensis NRRL Y-1626]